MEKIKMCENGGCMAKLSGGELARLLGASLGSFSPEDSSVFEIDGVKMLSSLDFGPLVGDDPYAAGQIAALHAISDLYVSGGTPQFALVILQIADGMSMSSAKLIVDGVKTACAREHVQILGGHTIRGESVLVGLSAVGKAGIVDLSGTKKRSVPGDTLMMSKALGTGIASRAYFHKFIDSERYQQAIESMLISNSNALQAFRATDIHACTDVTGFGLIGHLSEMLPKGCGASLELGKIRFFDCLQGLPLNALFSSYIYNNIEYVERAMGCDIEVDCIEKLALFDPQTNGPILLSVAPENAALLEDCGFYAIGTVDATGEITLR